MRTLFLAIRLAFNNLQGNFGRTLVTLVGIIISVAAIILVVSAGESVKQYVLGQVEVFGTDYIEVEVRVPSGKETPSSSPDQLAGIGNITTMKLGDGEAIAKLPNVQDWYAGMIGQSLVQYENVSKQVMLFGASPSVIRVDTSTKLSEGTFYSTADDSGLARVVVLGSGVKDTLFGLEDAIGKKIKIKGQSYRVIGVLEPRASAAGFFSFDDMIYMPVQTLQKKILGVDNVSFIFFKIKDTSIQETTAEQMRVILRDRHDITDKTKDDFQVTTVQEAQDLITQVFGAINFLLLALASISLVVGGVGIMNVMFVAVSERTSEIGLRKALGARSGDVLKQFLIEALVIALVGGLLGIAIGSGLLFIGITLLAHAGFDVMLGLTLQTVGIAVGFSAVAGVVFGIYPAWRASKTAPVEAMRSEA